MPMIPLEATIESETNGSIEPIPDNKDNKIPIMKIVIKFLKTT